MKRRQSRSIGGLLGITELRKKRESKRVKLISTLRRVQSRSQLFGGSGVNFGGDESAKILFGEDNFPPPHIFTTVNLIWGVGG